MIYLLANREPEAAAWASARRIPLSQWRYVRTMRRMRECDVTRSTVLTILDGAEQVPEYDLIIAWARRVGLRIDDQSFGGALRE